MQIGQCFAVNQWNSNQQKDETSVKDRRDDQRHGFSGGLRRAGGDELLEHDEISFSNLPERSLPKPLRAPVAQQPAMLQLEKGSGHQNYPAI